MGEPLRTLRDIAQQLQLPESTVRYYRDAFAAYVPTVGRGRRRRYPTEAAEVLGEIANLYAAGRTREDIEAALGAAVSVETVPEAQAPLPATQPHDPVLATRLNREIERQEVMWQMVREIVRLGEAVERQHVILDGIVDRLTRESRQALPATASEDVPAANRDPKAVELTEELDALREALVQERELVERLRRSKLELERRAAEAETRLEDRERGPPGASFLARLRARSRDEGG